MEIFIRIIKRLYFLLWGDLITIPLPGNTSVGISLLVLILIPSGIYFTIRHPFFAISSFPGDGAHHGREEKRIQKRVPFPGCSL